jgi:hypothetical protein
MSEMFKGPAKYPEWEEWRAWHKHIGEVMTRECHRADDYTSDHYGSAYDKWPRYFETDIGRMISSAGLSWFFFCVIIVVFVIWAWLTQPPTVDVIYPT